MHVFVSEMGIIFFKFIYFVFEVFNRGCEAGNVGLVLMEIWWNGGGDVVVELFYKMLIGM